MSGPHISHRVPNRPLLDEHGTPMRHVLDYRPAQTRVSKHRAGRMAPMSKEERRVRGRFNRRSDQASKTRTIDRNLILRGVERGMVPGVWAQENGYLDA